MTPTQILIFTVVMSIIVGFFIFAVINRICECVEKTKIAKCENKQTLFDMLGLTKGEKDTDE